MIPYGENAAGPLLVPVMAASQQYAAQEPAQSLAVWNKLLSESDLAAQLKSEWDAPLSAFAATKLLAAVESDDEAQFAVVAGDILPGAALLSQDTLLAARSALRAGLPQ